MLQCKGLNVFYGESHILRDVSMDVQKGQVVCLMGRNGVGKTTLLKTIIGLLKPRTGLIAFNDKDVTGRSPDRRVAEGMAYVPQGRELFPHLTVAENLRLGFEARRGPQDQKSADLAYEEIYSIFPALPALLNRQGGVLSGGQQQQVAIGRALLTQPSLLLLDEPTEGIQPSIVMEIERVIEGFKNQRRFAMVLVEQYFEFAARLADAFVLMAKGAVVAAGPGNELTEEQVKRHLTV